MSTDTFSISSSGCPPGRTGEPGGSSSAKGEASGARQQEEFALIREVLAGSLPAWHRFCVQYSPLILGAARRILRDEDAARSVYVSTLENLRTRKLATFEGRARLTTWLSVVTRTEAMDYLRHEYGRRLLPGKLKGLSPEDQALFRMFYLEGWPLEDIRARLEDPCSELLCHHLADAFERINATLDGKSLRRAVYKVKAESVGAAAGRLLEFLDRTRFDREFQAAARSADYRVLEREARELCGEIFAEIDNLPPEDRRVLTLRFGEGRTAAETAAALGIPEPKRIYRLVDRILRTLRERVGDKTLGKAKTVYRSLG